MKTPDELYERVQELEREAQLASQTRQLFYFQRHKYTWYLWPCITYDSGVKDVCFSYLCWTLILQL